MKEVQGTLCKRGEWIGDYVGVVAVCKTVPRGYRFESCAVHDEVRECTRV